MNMRCLAFAVLSAAAFAAAGDVTLVRDGVAQCRVVVAEDAHLALKFGARELEKYLGIRPPASYPISLSVDEKSAELKEDGFVVDVRPEGLSIVGRNPRGALYGCYWLLRKYAGMRWLVPGDDGEYCVLAGRTVTVPEQRTVVAPFSRKRSIATHFGSAPLWEVRNGFVAGSIAGWYEDRRNPGVLSPRGVAAEELDSRPSAGGHVMSSLMYGSDWGHSKTGRLACAQAYFKAHPEWFPMIGGKRTVPKVSNESEPNPCLSNPELLDHMASNLIARIDIPYGRKGSYLIGNNDTTAWCECEKCRALDAPEAVTQGERADRYWWVVNELAKRVWKVIPEAKLGGWAYQDFWFPPCRVKPDKRLSVLISFNCQCWRHSLSDPDCTVNRALREIYTAWKKLGMPFVCNRDEIACTGSPGSDYLPSESVVIGNIRCFPDYGCAGSGYCLFRPPMEPEFCSWERKMWPFFGKNLRWSAMWQTIYLAGIFQWEPDADFEANWEEANALYYGKGWAGGFRDFKKLQTRLFLETPGCIGLGMTEDMCGRCLDAIGSEERLRTLLGKALAAAATDPDPRALRHLERDKEIFEMSWVDSAKKRRASLGAFDSYAAKDAIRVDGVLDEHDWRIAAVRPFLGKDRANLRTAWKADELRIAVEWAGGPIVVTYARPDTSDRVESLGVTKTGAVRSTVKDAEIKVRETDGIRTLEARVPLAATGWSCKAGGNWRITVGSPESPHDFVQMRLLPARQGVFKVEPTYPYWRNATFDEETKKGWGEFAKGCRKPHVEGGKDFYVTLPVEKGKACGQSYIAPGADPMRVTFRLRGRGKVLVWTASYHTKPRTTLVSETIKTTSVELADEWRTFSHDFVKLGAEDESVLIRFFAQDGAAADLDDVYVNPL